MPMTPEAKRELSSTIRAIRSRLLSDLHDSAESAYRPAVHEREAGLSEGARTKRKRLDDWIKEQERAESGRGQAKRTKDDIRRDAEKQAAYTLLNRLVFLRLLEASGLRKPFVVTGGWESPGYRDFRSLAPALVRDDVTEGYDFLLRLVFEDLALDLPGLFGHAGVAELIPVPASTIRYIVESLDAAALASCWTDDMTLGWVYQYWNDPEREALDAKLNAGGKLAPHEIASKTQMFTERYMVDWLLQNSLGPMWLAMCKKHGWTPEVDADGTLARLEERRVNWRAKRESGEVSLTELMPLQTEAERRWAYYLPQPIPDDAVEHALESIRDLKALDPAVGSGHFLVVLFDLLLALYREEAKHRGAEGEERWSTRAVVENILENNLHGIDLDPRAVQIAAAAIWLKAKRTCPGAQPERLNLVASSLRLASLADDDPALVELRREVERETSIPAELTDTILHALKGADHLGSLLRIDEAVNEAILRHEAAFGNVAQPVQRRLFGGIPPVQERLMLDRNATRNSVLERIEGFLAKHITGDDLGLRLRSEQLATGVRFVRALREGMYHLVVGNPPYQGTSKIQGEGYLGGSYSRGKADLYASFLERCLELARDHGITALLTMRSWMFDKQYADLRYWLLQNFDLRALGDFAVGAFDEVHNDLLSVTGSVFRKSAMSSDQSSALQPTPPNDRSYDRERTSRKKAATLCGLGVYRFNPLALRVVPEMPLIYWWTDQFREFYAGLPKLGDAAPVRNGLSTQLNSRFLRLVWEVSQSTLYLGRGDFSRCPHSDWVLYIKGGKGKSWFEDAHDIVRWTNFALEVKVYNEHVYGCYTKSVTSEHLYFRLGVAFTLIGNDFYARAHRYRSVFGHMGASVFPGETALAGTTCLLNSKNAQYVLCSLNPGLHFLVGDINRLPLFPSDGADAIFSQIEIPFTEHETHRENSVEISYPGPSSWRYARRWAQSAVDRPEGDALPPYCPEYDIEPPTDHLSFALGVALGRFGSNSEGIVNPSRDDLSLTLPAGILFLDGSLESDDHRDSLGNDASKQLHTAWSEHGHAIEERSDLRDYLRTQFFEGVHRKMYESRPIHWPLSSEKKTFVAWITIHRWTERTLRMLLADHLGEALKRLDGEIDDLRAAREGPDRSAAREAERRFAKVQKWREELIAFIAIVEQCAEQGPPPTDASCLPREVNARYNPDLDDGVMINSAAVWPLLLPQWKEPKKWWKELSTAKSKKKDYDWSHLAMRYWPTRVDGKCQTDPSLGVAHGCFWKYHPARAWAWELRLQDEIGPEFRIEEASYRGDGGHQAHRAAFLLDHADGALAAIEKEVLRRRKKRRAPVAELRILEPGLWSRHPEACYTLELRLIDKQGADFILLSPDEIDARAAYESQNPEQVDRRRKLLESVIAPEMFPADDDDEEPGDDEDPGDEAPDDVDELEVAT
jgi:hypothetical protein